MDRRTPPKCSYSTARPPDPTIYRSNGTDRAAGGATLVVVAPSPRMSTHGWANDSTWGVAGTCDNTFSFIVDHLPPILAVAKGGDIAAAAAKLRTAVADERVLGDRLPTWVDLSEVDWTGLVTSWVNDD